MRLGATQLTVAAWRSLSLAGVGVIPVTAALDEE